MTTTIVDAFGDGIIIEGNDGSVFLRDNGGQSAGRPLHVDYSFDVDAALRFARKLKKAAKRAAADR